MRLSGQSRERNHESSRGLSRGGDCVPEPPVERRTVHDWHLNGDGSLCLLRTVDLWNGRETAADLVVKASGWFIEYMLMERGLIEAMTENGIHSNKSLDALIRGLDL